MRRSERAAPTVRTFGDELARTTLHASVSTSWGRAMLVVVVGLVGSWLLTWAMGGAGHVVPHWYYLPILFVSLRFGASAAVVVAVAAGLMAGPLTPLDVAAGTPQDTVRWLTRLGFFVVVGWSMALLARPSLPSIVEEIRNRREELALRRAIDDGQLFVRYQPVIDLRSGKLHGVEALVRWAHPELGELGPDEFLPTAERCDLIHDLGRGVLAEAVRCGARWCEIAEAAGEPAPVVAVNMSVRELESPTLVPRIRDVLADVGLDPSLVCLEVTESSLVSDLEVSVARLAGLRTLGVKIAVDDFGTGYSSLSSVHRFPMDVLKVDRSFLTAIERDATTEALLGGLVLFARSLHLTTVAEGVETAEQAALVRDLGYDLVQGYHYGRPLLAHEVDQMLVGLPTRPAHEPRPTPARPRRRRPTW